MYYLSDADVIETLRQERLAEHEAATRSIARDAAAERLAAAQIKQAEWQRERAALQAATPALQAEVDALYVRLFAARDAALAAMQQLEDVERERDEIQRRVISRTSRLIKLSSWLGEAQDHAAFVAVPAYP